MIPYLDYINKRNFTIGIYVLLQHKQNDTAIIVIAHSSQKVLTNVVTVACKIQLHSNS